MKKSPKKQGEKIVKGINRATRKQYSSEEKIRIVLDGLSGEDSIAELCRREGISQGIYYKWSKHCPEVHVLMHERGLRGDREEAACWRHSVWHSSFLIDKMNFRSPVIQFFKSIKKVVTWYMLQKSFLYAV